MPIYAYKCTACGYARDVLQKMSDPLLTVCPQCGADQFVKQVTAAGFQLKGSGWYATDFKGGNAPAPTKDNKDNKDSASDTASDKASATPSDAPAASSAESGKATPAAPAPASPSAPAASSASPSTKAD